MLLPNKIVALEKLLPKYVHLCEICCSDSKLKMFTGCEPGKVQRRYRAALAGEQVVVLSDLLPMPTSPVQ